MSDKKVSFSDNLDYVPESSYNRDELFGSGLSSFIDTPQPQPQIVNDILQTPQISPPPIISEVPQQNNNNYRLNNINYGSSNNNNSLKSKGGKIMDSIKGIKKTLILGALTAFLVVIMSNFIFADEMSSMGEKMGKLKMSIVMFLMVFISYIIVHTLLMTLVDNFADANWLK